MTTKVNFRGVVLVSAAALALSGCHSAPKPSPSQPGASPSGSGSAAPSLDPSAAAAGATVLASYQRYQAAYAAASATSDYKNTELVGYLESPLKQNVVAHLLKLSNAGVVYVGSPHSNPTVSEVHLASNPQTVTISDCYDATDFRPVYKKNNSPVPVDTGSRRYIIVTNANNYGARGWLFNDSTSYPDRPC